MTNYTKSNTQFVPSNLEQARCRSRHMFTNRWRRILRGNIPCAEGGYIVFSFSFTQPITAKYLRLNIFERSSLWYIHIASVTSVARSLPFYSPIVKSHGSKRDVRFCSFTQPNKANISDCTYSNIFRCSIQDRTVILEARICVFLLAPSKKLRNKNDVLYYISSSYILFSEFTKA